MKKRLFPIICLLLLAMLATLTAFAEAAVSAETASEYVFSYGNMIQGENGEYKAFINGEEAQTFTIFYSYGSGVEIQEHLILEPTTEAKGDMVVLNCSSVIAPALSLTLVSGTLVAAWLLKKRKTES